MSPTPTQWPLVGRDDEMAEIATALARPDITGLVLSGPGGVGKSRLARESLALAEEAGYRTAQALATGSTSRIPLGALATVLPDLGDGAGLLQRARAALASGAGERPLVLLIDDAHLLDDVSAALVLSLSLTPGVVPLLTVRTGEDRPDAVTALWKDAGAVRIDIEPLDPDAVATLLEDVLGGPVAARDVDRLTHLSGGRPLALRELVSEARDRGTLARGHDGWTLHEQPTVPRRLAELIDERLARLGPATADLVAVLALAEPLPVEAVVGMGWGDELDALEVRGLVAITDGSGARVGQSVVTGTDAPHPTRAVRLDHPLYGEVALQRTGEVHRRELLSRGAAALEAHSATGTDRFRAVLWRLWAGEALPGEPLLDAARHAYLVGDYDRTRELAAAAWAAAPSPDAGHLLGFALGRAGRAEDAEEVLAAAEALARDDRDLVLITEARSENLFRGLDAPERSLRMSKEVEARLSDPTWRSELEAHRAMGVVQSGRITEALELVGPLLASGEPPRAFVKAAYAGGFALTHAGRPEDAAALATRALPVHEAIWSEDLFQTEPGVHHLVTLFALVASGRHLEAKPLLDLARALTRDALPRYGYAWTCYLSGMNALHRGHSAPAQVFFHEAIPIFTEGRQALMARWGWIGVATASALCHRVGDATRALDEAAALGCPTLRMNQALRAEAEAWTAVASNRTDEARTGLDRAADDALEVGDRWGAARLLHTLARCGDPRRALTRLEEVAAMAQGPLAALQLGHVRSLLAAEPAAIEALAEDLAATGIDIVAAEVFAQAVAAHRGAGDPAGAARCARRHATLLAACAGVRTPASPLLDGPVPLTRREREVALLAAERMTSKEIAARLGLSRRTVDNHLQRVFQKLGVSSRVDLAAHLAEVGPTG